MDKQILSEHYDQEYAKSTVREELLKPLKVKTYPRDRFEAAVYWGKGEGKILEIGAGSGNVISSLRESYDEYVVTEFCEEALKILRELFGNDAKVKIIKNDIEEKNLPFSREYFDTISMIAVVEHLINPISVLKYCHSLLKPGGKILIQTANMAKWTRRLKLLFGFFPSTGSRSEGFVTYEGEPTNLYDGGHLHYFTYRTLERILKEKIGFKKVQYCSQGGNFLSKLFPTLFSECFVIAMK